MNRRTLLTKALYSLILAIPILLISSSDMFAATFSFTPASGYVVEGGEFVIDILIDSEGDDITKARSVVTFDPTLVQLTKAERNNTLFEEFPEDEQSTDNSNGVVMLTGFTQTGSGTLYSTDGGADLYARLTFEAIDSGTVELDWEYSGSDVPFKSVIMADGSPPQNELDSKPSTASFVLEGTASDGGTTPVTGITDDTAFYIAGAAIIGAGFVFSGGRMIHNASRKVLSSDRRTLVEYDE